MTFTLKINADNAAFHGEGCPDEEHSCAGQALQIADILRGIVNRLDTEGLSGFFETILDVNGNTVGHYAIKREDYR